MFKKNGVQGWLHLAAIVVSAITSALAASQGVATPELGAAIGGGVNTVVATLNRFA